MNWRLRFILCTYFVYENIRCFASLLYSLLHLLQLRNVNQFTHFLPSLTYAPPHLSSHLTAFFSISTSQNLGELTHASTERLHSFIYPPRSFIPLFLALLHSRQTGSVHPPVPIQIQIYIQIMAPLLVPLIQIVIPLALLSAFSEATPIPYTYPDFDSSAGRSGVDVGTAGSGSGRGSEWRYGDPALMREVEGLRSRGWEEVSWYFLFLGLFIYIAILRINLPTTKCFLDELHSLLFIYQ